MAVSWPSMHAGHAWSKDKQSWPDRSAFISGMYVRRRYVDVRLWLVLVLCFVLFVSLHGELLAILDRSQLSEHWAGEELSLKDLPCRTLPGAADVVVIIKTSVGQVPISLPVHLSTTLRCYPNTLIFSDYGQDLGGYHIIDALEHVSPQIKEMHPDFRIWRQLREGRSPSEQQTLFGSAQQHHDDSNLGDDFWRLDRFKFLPVINRTLHEYPDKTWYVFVEADTYVLWQSLLVYLGSLDSSAPHYIGGQMLIDGIEFAQGGSGLVISRPALENVVDLFASHQDHWENFTSGHWAGDCVLGKAMRESGTPLTHAWPMFQGNDVGDMEYDRVGGNIKVICSPTLSYHHMTPSAIESMFNSEQRWMRENPYPSFLRHRDVFAKYMMAQITHSRTNWDNHCGHDEGPVDSLAACHQICETNPGCVQYSVNETGWCTSTWRPNLGEASPGIQSGWVYRRVREKYDYMEPCWEEEFVS